MSGWSNYERLLQLRFTASSDVGGGSIPQDGHKAVQKIAGQLTQGGRHPAPEVVNEFAQIFQECTPKKYGDVESVGHEPKKHPVDAEETRNSAKGEKKLTKQSERAPSQPERTNTRAPQQEELNPLADNVEPIDNSQCEYSAGSSFTDEPLIMDVNGGAMVSVETYVPPPLLLANEITPVVAARDIEEFMALVERHVERLAISQARTPEGQENQVMISLTGNIFHQASLLLTRTHTGWSIKTMGLNDENIARVKRQAHRLVERFAERGLGELEFDLIESVASK